MKQFLSLIWCSFFLATGIVAFARYLQPATFSPYMLVYLLFAACLSMIAATYKAPYEK
jgi:glycerol uptake facilitator-like aquaporin